MIQKVVLISLLFLFHAAARCETAQTQANRIAVKPQNTDHWFGEDKGRHFLASTILAGSGWHISRYHFDQPCRMSRVIGVSFSFAFGFAKEFNDYRKGGKFSFKDMAANCAGILFGVLFLLW